MANRSPTKRGATASAEDEGVTVLDELVGMSIAVVGVGLASPRVKVASGLNNFSENLRHGTGGTWCFFMRSLWTQFMKNGGKT